MSQDRRLGNKTDGKKSARLRQNRRTNGLFFAEASSWNPFAICELLRQRIQANRRRKKIWPDL